MISQHIYNFNLYLKYFKDVQPKTIINDAINIFSSLNLAEK